MATHLKLADVRSDAIPDVRSVLDETKTLIDDIPNWSRGKEYQGVVTRKNVDGPGPAWFSRTSIHEPVDGTFEEFWACLGVDHSLHELQYVPEVQTATLLGTFQGFEGWTLGYRFTPPVSDRVFTVLVVCIMDESPQRQGFVISLPLDVSGNADLKAKEPHGTRGHYVSVERVREVDGRVEWIMATKSSPGGLIPLILSESQMPKKISEDVPHVVAWIKAKRQPTTG